MRFQVFVVAAVANLRQGGTGTRRVLLKDGTILEFSRQPTILAELPPEVEADEYLEKVPIGDAPVKTELPPGSVPSDLSKVPWNGLVRLAKGLGIVTQGLNRQKVEAAIKDKQAAALAALLAEAEAEKLGSQNLPAGDVTGGEAKPPAGADLADGADGA